MRVGLDSIVHMSVRPYVHLSVRAFARKYDLRPYDGYPDQILISKFSTCNDRIRNLNSSFFFIP